MHILIQKDSSKTILLQQGEDPIIHHIIKCLFSSFHDIPQNDMWGCEQRLY